MISISDLLVVLTDRGIRLAVTGDGDLRIRGDQTHMDGLLIEEIKKHKEELVAALQSGLPFGLLSEEERAVVGEGYEDAYPMSALQAGMVFHTQLEQFNGIYHDILAEHVKCRWDRRCFEQALGVCIAENPLLRTGFRLEGERALQVVHRRGGLALGGGDLRGVGPEEQGRGGGGG